MPANFEKMCRRSGAYNLPWLIKLTGGTTNLFFVNDVINIIYNGNTYVASTFNYAPNKMESGFSGGGTLDISVIDNTVINLVEINPSVKMEVVGVLSDDSGVSEVKKYNHSYGTISGNRLKITFKFEKDDRLSMTFPALIFNHYNNRGN